MIRLDLITNNFALKIISLAVALILWFLVAAKKPAEQEFVVPITYKNIPSGLRVAGTFPETANILVIGPKLALLKLERQNITISLDMQKLKEGPVAFNDLAKYLDIPSGLSLIRISPSRVDVKLVIKP
jgi:YbbR domain-containing protein